MYSNGAVISFLCFKSNFEKVDFSAPLSVEINIIKGCFKNEKLIPYVYHLRFHHVWELINHELLSELGLMLFRWVVNTYSIQNDSQDISP